MPEFRGVIVTNKTREVVQRGMFVRLDKFKTEARSIAMTVQSGHGTVLVGGAAGDQLWVCEGSVLPLPSEGYFKHRKRKVRFNGETD